ncbi:YitT family protein [Virgibacillus xinjiangensis]|uniref:YitT family protein n=1 Tax=Virgibacillus xinjiangensis TaxID=393090 RepID=A0ABV7CVT6_9BACI
MNRFMWKGGLVVLGGTIQGFGMGLFLFPHFIPSGGAGGLAVLLNYTFGLGMGAALWVVNFTFLLLAVNYFGKRFVVWTVIAITITSLSVDFFQQQNLIVNRHLLYDLVLGSVFLGTGVGILMRQGVSNGGIGVVALMISSGRNILPGRPLFLLNGCIFVITALIIDLRLIFLALISQWISTKMVDLICQLQFYRLYTLGFRKKP